MIADLLRAHRFVLMEAAVVERVRRSCDVDLHPTLANAPLMYDAAGAAVLTRIYSEYMSIAEAASVPLLLCAPTWRANRERVHAAGVPSRLNQDAVQFMRGLCPADRPATSPILIGGMIGCRNDCYRPEQGLSARDAAAFHTWQVDALAEAGADFLIAETLPGLDEAIGIARAMAEKPVPYLISFVISRDGRVLDGTPMAEAMDRVDAATARPPAGYLVNCAYPTFLQAKRQPARLFTRLIGFQANASSLDQAELDGAAGLKQEGVSAWGEAMLDLHRTHGMQILGGCCGTGPEHLRYLTDHAAPAP